MKTIKIKKYEELEKLREENAFIVDISEASTHLKARIIDFLGGLTLVNGSLKKISNNCYEVVMNKGCDNSVI